MFVVTADQRGSTRKGDRVESLMSELRPWMERWDADVALPLERTVGDEVQIVLTGPAAAVDLALHLMRVGDWSVGVGAGPVNEPWGESARASSGAAFVHARQAVERARGRSEPVPVVAAGEDADAAESATAVLQLLASVVRRRSDAGWEVADLLGPDATQREVATRLGISEQAVSQRVTSAMLDEERRARPVAADLLVSAESKGARP
ncbi:winged helix-turn-helix domain-containing protein [Demequina muriae]|uniref:Winged helix-turn-helix domain-containing protein n=1 Tax=Demequina muriae TaxID=3051664 RepID=A0ABT8GJN4_9MICO|nr:winged helix-turn-helix domain-containing protein [Demequina sp. EGI L300058]MDN4481648.1 winged helix-turn-helix domain-containing protein [Demequina sp. EGI L300058]